MMLDTIVEKGKVIAALHVKDGRYRIHWPTGKVEYFFDEADAREAFRVYRALRTA